MLFKKFDLAHALEGAEKVKSHINKYSILIEDHSFTGDEVQCDILVGTVDWERNQDIVNLKSGSLRIRAIRSAYFMVRSLHSPLLASRCSSK